MPQSMLGLLALTLATLISFNQQRLRQQSYKATIHNEIELAAAGTAQHVIEMISARSFDETTTPEAIFNAGTVPMGASGFTRSDEGEYGRYNGDGECDLMVPGAQLKCDDVDDLDGIQGAPVQALLSDGRVLEFLADVDVFYVDEPGSTTPADDPTLHKRVDLSLRAQNQFLGREELLTLSRVVSYDPVRADANMEAQCGPIGTSGSSCERIGGTGEVED